MSLPPYAVQFRDMPACPCQARWIPVFERELIARGVIRECVDIAQLIGDAETSGDTHTGGGVSDFWQHDDVTVWVARQMGADATWARTTGSFAANKHTHSVLTGCPHNAPARYQIDEVRADGDGLLGGAPDSGPRPLSGRTWREGIEWANKQHERRQKEQDMPNYSEWALADKQALAKDVADEVLDRTVKVLGAGGAKKEVTVRQAIARVANGIIVVREDVRDNADELAVIQSTLDEMNS